MNMTRCLTLRQPWASAILLLGKNVENRGKRMAHRGPLGIHAGRFVTLDEFNQSMDTIRAIAGDHPAWPEFEAHAQDVRGAVAGLVDVTGCVNNSPSPWAQPGHWHITLAHPRLLDQLVAARGQLWLFDVNLGNAVTV